MLTYINVSIIESTNKNIDDNDNSIKVFLLFFIYYFILYYLCIACLLAPGNSLMNFKKGLK